MIVNLDQLKAQISIKDIIASYLPLKKDGSLYKAICPFHSEKTPSFVVNERKNFFHCFGCKASGDAFSFLQKLKHYDFKESLEEIADFYNFKLEFNGIKLKEKKDYFAFYERINAYSKQNLLKNEKLLSYLAKRGLDKADLAHFDIGLMPDNYTLLELVGKERDLALELGFLKQAQTGLYSQFARRISFALRNPAFKIVGFSARVHPYENFSKSAKYINSSESFLFKKSQFLYNLNFAKDNLSKAQKKDSQSEESQEISAQSIIIVEGFLDCIALSKFGFKNAVASLGTAFNTTHLATLLKAGFDDFLLCFDNDEAGFKASLRACELLFKNSFFESKIWHFNQGFKDIGELLEKSISDEAFSPSFFKENAFKFYIKSRLDECQSQRAKDQFLKALIKSINAQKNYYTKAFCAQILQDLTGLSLKQSPQSVNLVFSEEAAVLKTALQDKNAAFILANSPPSFKDEKLKASLELFLSKNELDLVAKELLSTDELKSLNELDFAAACISIEEGFLRQELNRAKASKNLNLVLSLSEKLAALKNEDLTPF